MSEDVKEDLYEFEINRFQDLLEQDRDSAFQRYGWSLLYSLPPEEIFKHKNGLGWKGEEPLDFYNYGVLECEEDRLTEAMEFFQKAESMECELSDDIPVP